MAHVKYFSLTKCFQIYADATLVFPLLVGETFAAYHNNSLKQTVQLPLEVKS